MKLSQAFPALFSGVEVGRRSLRNRCVVAPMERNYADPVGLVTDRMLGHFDSVAGGGAGWVNVEAAFIHASGRGRARQLGMHEDGCIPGLRSLTSVIRRHGALAGIQLHHAGRNTSTRVTGMPVRAPSPVPCVPAGGDIPEPLTQAEIADLVRCYQRAGIRALEAGFDVVELHAGHGYLPMAFLSPLTNLRTDSYGRSLENRSRFALEVIAALRRIVPSDRLLGCRLSVSEFRDGGLGTAECIAFAQFAAAAGLDYLSVSAACYESRHLMIPPMDVPSGWLLPEARKVREATGIPTIGVSRMDTPAGADAAITAGDVDLVAFGRAFLADPAFAMKAASGRQREITRCIACNQGCTGRLGQGLETSCLVNPSTGRERERRWFPAEVSKTVLVVGGGPAGMEAVRIAGERGHRAHLVEKLGELGGQVRLAGQLPYREGWAKMVDDLSEKVRRSGATVQLNTEFSAEELETLAPDVLICATGARTEVPQLDSGGLVDALDAMEVLGAGHRMHGRALVVGGTRIGLGLAEWLADLGDEVIVVEESGTLGQDVERGTLLALTERLAKTSRITVHLGHALQGIKQGTATLVRPGAFGNLDAITVPDVDRVIYADRRRSQGTLAAVARARSLVGEIYEIGDAVEPRTAWEAIVEGNDVGRRV